MKQPAERREERLRAERVAGREEGLDVVGGGARRQVPDIRPVGLQVTGEQHLVRRVVLQVIADEGPVPRRDHTGVEHQVGRECGQQRPAGVQPARKLMARQREAGHDEHDQQRQQHGVAGARRVDPQAERHCDAEPERREQRIVQPCAGRPLGEQPEAGRRDPHRDRDHGQRSDVVPQAG
jgi:hypothetical protein